MKKEKSAVQQMEQVPAQRYQADIANGLSQEQVQERIDSGWTNETVTAESKTVGQIVKSKIAVHPDSFDWYLRFNDDPDKPLHCTLEGKRKQTTKIMVSGGNSPTMDCSDTGCHQGRQVMA